MTFVEMFHPEAGGIAKIPLSAVPNHLTLGWLINEPPDGSSEPDHTHEEND